MTLRNRLTKLEATAARVVPTTCPTCRSDDGGVSTYRRAIAEQQLDGTLRATSFGGGYRLFEKGPPGTPDKPTWYGEDLRCRECGARSRGIMICIPPTAEESAYIHGLETDAKP